PKNPPPVTKQECSQSVTQTANDFFAALHTHKNSLGSSPLNSLEFLRGASLIAAAFTSPDSFSHEDVFNASEHFLDLLLMASAPDQLWDLKANWESALAKKPAD